MRGFMPLHLLIPIAAIAFALVIVVKVKNIDVAQKFMVPLTIKRAIEQNPNLQSQQISGDLIPLPTAEPTPSPSPTPQDTISSTVDAKIAPPSPTPAPKPTFAAGGSTSTGGNYTVVTYSLGSISVVTDSANDDDCGNNCPAKPLAQYVAENGGRGGINGTYFCPPDYSSCSEKVNTYDFPIWNNRKKKWMRADTLFWNGRGMMIFRGGSAQFFPSAGAVGAPSDITGGIVNYPSLVSGGQIILDEGTLSDNLKVTKGTRSGIGFGNGKLFLVVARSANMRDLANIFMALGATDALNLDGGGSSAIYDGGYKAGPGRALPNALIVK